MLVDREGRRAFVCVPRSSTTSVSIALRGLGWQNIAGVKHTPACEASRWSCGVAEDYDLAGTVRPPLAWYPSLWCYSESVRHRWPDQATPCYGDSGETPRARFRSWLSGATRHTPTEGSPKFFGGAVPGPGSHFIDTSREAFAKHPALGLWSFTLLFMLGDLVAWREGRPGTWGVQALINAERPVEGLSGWLGHPVSVRRTNSSASRLPGFGVPANPLDWYDAESLGWVEAADRTVADALDCDLLTGPVWDFKRTGA